MLIPALVFKGVSATLWANSHHTATLDFLFYHISYLAQWPIIVAAIVTALYKDYIRGIWAGICYGIQALLVNGLKFILNEPRPLQELGINQMHNISGDVIHSFQSFPSGHTAAAVLGLAILAAHFPKKYLQIAFFVMAVLVGYSRLYLGQHYLRDVLAGASISLLISLVYIFPPQFIVKFQKLHD